MAPYISNYPDRYFRLDKCHRILGAHSSTVIHLCACVANQATAADKDGQAQRRMKEVVTRRRLLELARAQTDEVRALSPLQIIMHG